MKKIGAIILLFISFNAFSEGKTIRADDHEALAKEGIIVISEEHKYPPNMKAPPALLTNIKKPHNFPTFKKPSSEK